MTRLRERRLRVGRYEWRCACGRWYAKLRTHVHRYHRAECICSDACKARRRAFLRRLDPLANPQR